MKASAVRKSAKEKAGAEQLATQLSAVELVFERKVGENEHLFGSVTSGDIAHELEAKGFTIDRRKISLDEPLKTLGEYHVPVKLHREVTSHVKVTVKGDQPDAEEATRSRNRLAAFSSTKRNASACGERSPWLVRFVLQSAGTNCVAAIRT